MIITNRIYRAVYRHGAYIVRALAKQLRKLLIVVSINIKSSRLHYIKVTE